MGSIIAGSYDFINKARKWRKRLGGGLRQVGMVAAPGIVALSEMVDRLAEDHKHARRLAEGIDQISGLSLEGQVETNIVLVNVADLGKSADEFLIDLKKVEVLAVPFGPETIRFVTNYDVNAKDIESVITCVEQLVSNC